jgi:hypothetical protein
MLKLHYVINYIIFNFFITLINTIKDEFPATFVSLKIIMYPAILSADLPF